MASKKYAYYNKGNKIALIQQDTTDATSEDYTKYKSPTESVTNGMEIEYSYSPSYNLSGQKILGVDRFLFPFWANIDGFLAFLRPGTAHNAASPFQDLTAAPFNSISNASSQTNDYILIENSGIWDGIHKVKAVSTGGVVTTYTEVSGQSNYRTDQALDFISTDNQIYDGDTPSASGDDFLGRNYSAGDWVFVTGSGENVNNGFWKVAVANELAGLPQSSIEVSDKVSVLLEGSSEVSIFTTASIVTESDQTDISIMQAYPIFNCMLSADVKIMEDESFKLDLNRYQANAVVLYLKARKAEDEQDIERFEYYMSKFRKQMGKAEAARKRGPYISQGFWHLKS